MKKLRIVLKICELTIFVLCIICMHIHDESKIKKIQLENNMKNLELEQKVVSAQKDAQSYQIMFSVTEKQINDYKKERDEAVNKYNYIQEQVKYSKLNNDVPNRGDYANKTLSQYPIITIDEMNEYINRVSPINSPFIGKGEIFLKASKITDLDPRYIFSHAAVESGYGASNIAVNKGNYFGINAQNSNPDLAYSMGDNLEDGIINGAIWIRKNYTNKGYDTLNKMIYNGHYCLTDDGEPSQKWIDDISFIALK